MKLSVQQLAAAYKDNSQKFDQIFEKVTSTIISQIEILKNIASEFTNYARMPRASLVKVNVIVLVSEIINLYAEQNKYVEGIYHAKEINIVADSDHFKRTLVNLIRNSLQANSDKVLIDVAMESEFCVIRVIDNGMGITQDILPEIYNDKFTTKVSGMGLGLSMAKKYIESINGKIEVEKTNTSGTTFVITIQIA
jgi:nitrogen fixation/metabolism regulation signal transduction histidine kinase